MTPFMCMLGELKARRVKGDVVMLYSARGEEGELATQFKEAGIQKKVFDTEGGGEECEWATQFKEAGIQTKVFDTEGEGEDGEVVKRRIKFEDVEGVEDLRERGVYLCGPDGFMKVVQGYLENAGVNAGNINVETFAF